MSKLLGLLAIFLASASSASAIDQIKDTISLNDVLKIEGIGDARFSADGKWLAYNLLPPYDEMGDYSYWLYAYRLSGHQVWIKEVSTDDPPRLQPGLDTKATNFLFGLSPDAKHIVVLQHKLGRLRLVSCEIGKSACSYFDEMPDIRDRYVSSAPWNERLVWVSPTSFMMPTRDYFAPGSEMRSRGTSGKFLWEKWHSAWRGEVPTSTEVISTGKDRSNDWAQGALVIFDVETGKSRVVAIGRYAGARLNSQKSTLIAARVGERIRPSAHARPVPKETHPIWDRRYSPQLIDLTTNIVTNIPVPFNVDPNSFTWSENGKSVAMFGWEESRSSDEGCFYVVMISSPGTAECVTPGYDLENNRYSDEFAWNPGPARAVLTNAGLVALSRSNRGDAYKWLLFDAGSNAKDLAQGMDIPSGDPIFGGSRNVVFLGEHGIDILRTDTNTAPESLAREHKLARIGASIQYTHSWSNEFRFGSPRHRNPFQMEIALAVKDDEDKYDQAILFIDDLDKAHPSYTEYMLGVVGAQVIAATNAGVNAAVLSVKEGNATRLLLTREGKEPQSLALINQHLDNVRYAQKRDVSYTLSDPDDPNSKLAIDACVLLPPDASRNERLPLVIEAYPIGVPATCDTIEDFPFPRVSPSDLWAARGFAYMRPAIPLDFARTKDGPIAGMDDILDQTIDALVAQKLVDPERVVLYGFSQGGISSLYVATQSDKFAAIISMNGWSDFLSHYYGSRGLMRYFHLDQNGGDNRWRYECAEEGAEHLCPFGFGSTPFENPELFARMSPVTMADNISAPVMLIHSDLDYFDIAQYDEMFGALYRTGKEARYVRYWGEGHGPSSPANIRDLWRRIDDFLTDAGIMPTQQN